MLTKGFLKPEISIEKLGKRQFWTGIIMGVLFSFVFSYFFNYSRESLRTITYISELLILPENDSRMYDLFFATLATSLGFGFTIINWLSGRKRNIKKKYLAAFTVSNAWLITFITLMVVARFGSILPIFMYRQGYDDQFNILHDFWLILLLIPIYCFLAQWNTIRLIFRTRHWFFISILFYFVTSFYLYKTTSVDRDVLNQKHYLKNKERLDYIDSEFIKAKKLGVFFNDTTKQILKKKYAERTVNLVYRLKQAFETDKIVPLDTLILEKIVIHTMNRHNLHHFGHPNDRDKNWPYALPENIYNQIYKHDVNSKETELLFNILAEQIELLKTPELNWREVEKYTEYEKEKSLFRRNLMYTTKTIQSRLIQVADKLKSDKQYKKYHHLLPDIQFDNFHGIQKYHELELSGSYRIN